MNLTEILNVLRQRGCTLCLEGGNLRIKCPKGQLSEALVKAVTAYKPLIVERMMKEACKPQEKGGA